MSAIPKFDSASTCPKCGGDDVNSHWTDGTDYAHRYPPSSGCRQSGEHIDRRCQTCHFLWPEACLDAPAPKKQKLVL